MAHIQFSHANGLPAHCYDYLFELLQPHSISFVETLGMGKYEVVKNWEPLVEELIDTIEHEGNAPVVGMGHSLGGVVTMWAASRRPDLFERVIVLDPPFLSRKFRLQIRLVRAILSVEQGMKIVPLSKMALRRRDRFESMEAAHAYWQPKGFFKQFHPRCFEDYARHTLAQTPEGDYSLRIPKELEARIFACTPHKLGATKPGIPSHYLYATDPKYGIVPEKEIQNFHTRAFPETEFIGMDSGHMFPLEMPEQTAAIILRLIGG